MSIFPRLVNGCKVTCFFHLAQDNNVFFWVFVLPKGKKNVVLKFKYHGYAL